MSEVIVRKVKSSLNKEFKNVLRGQIFEYDGELYIRMEKGDVVGNSMRVSDRQTKTFFPENKVSIPHKLMINYY